MNLIAAAIIGIAIIVILIAVCNACLGPWP